MGHYNFGEIEPRWQSYWENNKTFSAINGDARPKYYALDMFPYPSGTGLHIGHPEGYTASDILARYQKANGKNVLHPMGWDAFGLPAEQHALTTGVHPAINTASNVNVFRAQIKRLGFAIDWDREINTTDTDYYKWTQWIFLKLFKHGLAYVDERPVWWCPALGTVLANEEIVDGVSERGSHPVERRNLRQWVLRITAYAEKLIEGLETLDWPESTKAQQIAWIGKSEGAEVQFALQGRPETITIFTTRLDTLCGVTYMVLSPEHPLVPLITSDAQRNAVNEYQAAAGRKSDLTRTDLVKDKTGVLTGGYAIHPVSGETVPIWIADYVLMSYGTGAVMAVPAHDERDYAFAQKYNIPVQQVIANKNGDTPLPYCDDGILINSKKYSNLDSRSARAQIVQDLQEAKQGRRAVHFKLRDWLFSRQRYWGEPFPIIWVKNADYEKLITLKDSPFLEFLPSKPVAYDENGERYCAVPLPSAQLPLKLPDVTTYKPAGTGESPLANATEWTCIAFNPKTGEILPKDTAPADWITGRRETNTMPQWAGSCWYHLRYMSPKCTTAPVDREAEKYWGTPDYYIGGAEHAVLHLLYARFWHRFLYDIGVVSSPEPFKKLFHQGIILGEDGTKMSKSRGNVVNPDDIIKEYGADALRMFEMFLGPLEAMKPWNTKGIEGISRFLKRLWREIVVPEGLNPKIQNSGTEPAELAQLLNETVHKVSTDIEQLRFNTAISQLMITVNAMQAAPHFTLQTAKTVVQLLAPFAPHVAEELWSRLGETRSISEAPWPTVDRERLERKEIKLVVQVNGKARAEIIVPQQASQEEVLQVAKNDQKIMLLIANNTVLKEIYVPGKVVNLVVH